MDFVFELLFQVVFEFFADALFEVGYQRTARVLRSKVGRYTVSAAVGFAGGVWWGNYLSDAGIGHRPRLFWISIAMAVLAAAAAVVRSRVPARTTDTSLLGTLQGVAAPWKWPTHRLAGFAVLNAAIAVGIAIGYTPPIPG